ncbi:MAG: GNAT family N-acetyltransferase [Deltaproteobacteria bacterium]|nr:GNAT family N-acetyltransferase [Deltaproteobacteria bacterium]
MAWIRDVPMTERRFDQDYREPVVLRDGTAATRRLLRAEDRELLERGFEKLSERSRYYRFFSPKPRLSQAEARYLTDVDGEAHVAIGASVAGADGGEEGLGVARFVRLAEEPDVAEAAVTVLDDVQGKGLGSLLLMRLIAAARERHVKSFRCWVLADNKDMLKLLHDLLPDAHERFENGGVQVDATLPEVAWNQVQADRPRQDGLYRLLKSAAAGALVVLGLPRRLAPGGVSSEAGAANDARPAPGPTEPGDT